MSELHQSSNAWPFREARRIKAPQSREPAIFETGFGPSGLPHIGTFAEVIRTTMVRRAYEMLTGGPTRLIVFSDDMDAMRKVPENIPNPEKLEEFIGVSLSRVPDPFGTHESFAHHNNAMLCEFLDRFGIDYEFMSATEQYRDNISFHGAMRLFHDQREFIESVILPTLGPDRRATYSAFMPIDANGRVYHGEVLSHDVDAETLTYRDPATGKLVETSIIGGTCKLQWKADWAMRWHALEVDYEMAGKDLIDSVKLSTEISRGLGNRPPQTFIYEMFLDADGRKISKSLGNGLTIDEWLRYGSQESLRAFLFANPQTAKRLHHAVVPRAEDDYIDALRKFEGQTDKERLGNPVYHVHGDAPPPPPVVNFGLLRTLATVMSATTPDDIAACVERYCGVDADDDIVDLTYRVMSYRIDHGMQEIYYRTPTEIERAAFRDLAERFCKVCSAIEPVTEEELQFQVYEVGKEHGFDPLRDWFKALYECLLGQSSGPRFGTFAKLFGVSSTIDLLLQA